MNNNDTSFYDALNEVLATSRYDRLTGRRIDLRERASQWLSDTLNRFFSRIDWEVTLPTFIYNLDAISLAFIAIGVTLAVVAAIVIFRTYMGKRRAQQHDLSDIFEELIRKDYSVAELISLSDQADSKRLAIRYRYIAALLSLNEKQVIEIKPSATNALILRQVKTAAPTLLPAFECTADVFQRAWFGYKDIGDDRYQNFTQSVDTLVMHHG